MDHLRGDIRAAFARQQAGLRAPSEAGTRLLRNALEEARRPRLFPTFMGAAATLVVAGGVALFVLLTHGQMRVQQLAPNSIEQALTGGRAAVVAAGSERSFVWLTGDLIQPQPSGSQGGRVIGVTVRVIDWTGKLRYHFNLPQPGQAGVPNQIQAISPDGTRALLADGTVLDQTGAAVGKLTALTVNGMPGNSVHWMADDRHVCAAFSNEQVISVTMPPKGQPNAPSPPPQPYTKPDADHSVTLKVFGLDGSVRTVATVARGPQGVASGPFGDSVSVLSCNAGQDLAVIARYHDADTSGGQTSTNMTVSLWAIKLSTGAVAYHQGETRMALGRAFFFGSQNAKLAVEFLWNSKVAGAETDVVLRMPSGEQVPVLDAEPIPDTPAVSADGTRILRRVLDQAHGQTELELIDAATGRIVRRVVIPASVGASAVAQPDGSSFIVQVQGYMALVDGNGGVSLIHPNLSLQNGPGLPAPGNVGLPPLPIQN